MKGARVLAVDVAGRVGAGASLGWCFVRYVIARFFRDGCMAAAGALSYTTLLSLVPLIALGLAVLSAFPIFADTRDQLLGSLFGRFVPEIGAQAEYWFRYFAGAAVRTTTIGILALAVTVLLLLATIEDQLHNIWHVRSHRPWVQRILAYWAIVTLGPLLLGTAFSLPSYLTLAASRHGLDASALAALPTVRPLVAVLPFVLETIAFTLLYELIPNCAVRWREALAGGVVTAVLIDALRVGFVLYLKYVASYRAVYGALAGIPIFLLWMYVVWSAVLFGGVVAAALPRWRTASSDAASVAAVERLGLGLALLAELAENVRSGGAIPTPALARRLGVATTAVEDALTVLARAGFTIESASGGWALARALDSSTLLDFYRALGLPLAQSLDAAQAFPWQTRIAEAIHRIAAVEERALTTKLSEVLQDTPAAPRPHVVPQRR